MIHKAISFIQNNGDEGKYTNSVIDFDINFNFVDNYSNVRVSMHGNRYLLMK